VPDTPARYAGLVSELTKIYDVLKSATIAEILAFAALVLPGLVALRAYEAKRGGEPRKTNEALVDILGYSLVADFVGEAVLAAANVFPRPYRIPVYVVDVVVTFVLVPIALGWGWYQLQEFMARTGYVVDPIKKPWDRVFGRIAKERLDLAAVITLHDGRRVAGRLADPAYASQYPASEQLMLGEIWRLDQERGMFIERVRGSWGMLVDKADCETIEFVRWSEIAADLKNTKFDEGNDEQRD
jgi:Family of unknown function (DUF6338)